MPVDVAHAWSLPPISMSVNIDACRSQGSWSRIPDVGASQPTVSHHLKTLRQAGRSPPRDAALGLLPGHPARGRRAVGHARSTHLPATAPPGAARQYAAGGNA
ncbi:ArsR family transcriptional regulator [Streptomyces sp. NPDC058678]|uniref:ArsR family transcriptional regulator n=1 Tax=Streptomyces sp. NPDC058678 TaxID=3346595 RepID=UPI003655EF2C